MGKVRRLSQVPGCPDREQRDPIYLKDKVTQRHFKEQFETAQKIEQEYSRYFTGRYASGPKRSGWQGRTQPSQGCPSNLEVLQPALPGCLVMPPQWALSLQTVLLQAQGSIGGLSVQR